MLLICQWLLCLIVLDSQYTFKAKQFEREMVPRAAHYQRKCFFVGNNMNDENDFKGGKISASGQLSKIGASFNMAFVRSGFLEPGQKTEIYVLYFLKNFSSLYFINSLFIIYSFFRLSFKSWTKRSKTLNICYGWV